MLTSSHMQSIPEEEDARGLTELRSDIANLKCKIACIMSFTLGWLVGVFQISIYQIYKIN